MKKLEGKLGILIVAMLVVCVFCTGLLSTKVHASEAYNVNMNINMMMEEFDAMIENSDENMLSSNPYDYIDNQYFDNIINRGISALPTITEEIESSENSGLREYMLAIAAEEITNTHLNKENVYNWSNGKEWLDKWNIYLRNIPTKVDYIVNDTENTIEEKKSALNDLGIMSLPYIKDSIDAGHTEFQDTYNSILEGTAVSSRTNDNEKIDESDLQIIRSMVEEVRVD